MNMNELKVGERAKILNYIPGSRPSRQRLLVMGLTPDTVVQLMRIAPFGDPLQLHVRGCNLSLRKSEANLIQVEKIT